MAEELTAIAGSLLASGLLPFLQTHTSVFASTSNPAFITLDTIPTPAEGTYVVIFSGTGGNTNNNKTAAFGIAVAGVDEADSERGIGGGPASTFACLAVVTVDGTQDIQSRFRADTAPPSNSTEVTSRWLFALRLGS